MDFNLNTALIILNLAGLAFGCGKLWQMVKNNDKRIARIETILNGFLASALKGNPSRGRKGKKEK